DADSGRATGRSGLPRRARTSIPGRSRSGAPACSGHTGRPIPGSGHRAPQVRRRGSLVHRSPAPAGQALELGGLVAIDRPVSMSRPVGGLPDRERKAVDGRSRLEGQRPAVLEEPPGEPHPGVEEGVDDLPLAGVVATDRLLAHEAPRPVVARLERAHERVPGLGEVGGRMAVRARVAAAGPAADQTLAEVDPRAADRRARLACARAGTDVGDQVEMAAGRVHRRTVHRLRPRRRCDGAILGRLPCPNRSAEPVARPGRTGPAQSSNRSTRPTCPTAARGSRMPDMITAEGLVKIYKGRKSEVRALDGLDLTVPKGTVLGLLGPNGAGKTTAVRILATLLKPDAGHATVAGYDVVREPDAIRKVIGLSGQYAAVDENLTGSENLWLFGRLYQLPSPEAKARAAELLEQFDLVDARDRVVK